MAGPTAPVTDMILKDCKVLDGGAVWLRYEIGTARRTMAITVKPRHPALGAEIHGVHMRKPMDEQTRQQVHDAWMKHLVVVFPDQPITDQQHVAFTRNFGEAEDFHQHRCVCARTG